MRFELRRFADAARIEIPAPVGAGLRLVFRQDWNLILRGGDDELADAAMFDTVARAEAIQHLLAGDTQSRLERTGLIVDAGMDDLGVAAAGAGTDCILGLEYDDFPAFECQRA